MRNPTPCGKTNRGDIGFSTPSHAFIPAASRPQGTSKESSKESIKEKDSLHTGGEDSLRRNPFEDEEPLRENDPACVEPNGSDTDTTETTHEHILQNESKLSDVVKKAQPKWGESKRNHVVIDLAEAISDPNTPLDRDDIMRLLATEPPSYVDRGDTWLRRMLAKHAHASPGNGKRDIRITQPSTKEEFEREIREMEEAQKRAKSKSKN